jgi:hypothetical protein
MLLGSLGRLGAARGGVGRGLRLDGVAHRPIGTGQVAAVATLAVVADEDWLSGRDGVKDAVRCSGAILRPPALALSTRAQTLGAVGAEAGTSLLSVGDADVGDGNVHIEASGAQRAGERVDDLTVG